MAELQSYRVKSGDTLSIIARDVLGDVGAWPKLAQLNQINKPFVIQPGQLLILPDLSVPGPIVVPATTEPRVAPGGYDPRAVPAAPGIADFLSGVNPYVWYIAAGVVLLLLMDRK